ncbi:hypothetical protein HDU77_008258 [Chytriomyces hyalinus]|nr:hypothetical protein HDU77_008258 [Chytriomyces hyalinus]
MLLPTILAAVSIVAPQFVRAADANLCKSLSIPEGGWVCTGDRTFSQCSYGVPSSFAGQPCAEGTVCCQSSSQCDYASNCKATYKDSLGSASASSDNGSSNQGQYAAPASAVNPPSSMPNVPPAVYSPLTMPPAVTPTTPAPTPVSSYSVAPTPVPTPTPTGPEAQPYGGWGSTGGYAPPPKAEPVNYNAPVQTPAPNAWLYNPVPIEGYGIPAETPVPAPVQYYNYAPQPEGYGAPPREYHSWRHHPHTPPCTTPRPVYMTHHRHHWKAPWTTKSRHHHYPTKTTTVPKPQATKAGYKHGKGYKHMPKHHKKPFEGYPVNDPLAWGIDFTVPKNADGGDLAAPYGRYMQPQKGEDTGVYGEYGPDDLQPVAGKVGYAIPPKQESRYGAYGSEGEWPASYGDDAYRKPAPQPHGYGEPAKPVGYGNPAPVPVGYGNPAPAPVGYGKSADKPKGYGEQEGYGKPAPAPVGYGNPAPVPVGYGNPAPAPVGYGNPAPVPVGYGKPADKPKGYGEQEGYSKPAPAPVGYGNPAPVPVGYGKPAPAPVGYGNPAPVPVGYGKPAPAPVGYGNPAPVPVGYGKPAEKPMGYGEPAGYGHPAPAPVGYGSDSMPKGYGDAMPEPQQYGYTHAKPDSSYGGSEPQGYKQKKPKAGDYAKYLASLPPAIRYKRPASSYLQHSGPKGYGGKAAEPASYGAAPAMPGYDQKAPQVPAGYYGRGSK